MATDFRMFLGLGEAGCPTFPDCGAVPSWPYIFTASVNEIVCVHFWENLIFQRLEWLKSLTETTLRYVCNQKHFFFF